MLQGLPPGKKLTWLAILAGKSSPWTNRRYTNSNGCNGLQPRRLTWNLRVHPWKRNIIFRFTIFRLYVNHLTWFLSPCKVDVKAANLMIFLIIHPRSPTFFCNCCCLSETMFSVRTSKIQQKHASSQSFRSSSLPTEFIQPIAVDLTWQIRPPTILGADTPRVWRKGWLFHMRHRGKWSPPRLISCFQLAGGLVNLWKKNDSSRLFNFCLHNLQTPLHSFEHVDIKFKDTSSLVQKLQELSPLA